ncbi:hypothetical protein GQ457_08G005560 [Hibiscus cannabinus]
MSLTATQKSWRGLGSEADAKAKSVRQAASFISFFSLCLLSYFLFRTANPNFGQYPKIRRMGVIDGLLRQIKKDIKEINHMFVLYNLREVIFFEEAKAMHDIRMKKSLENIKSLQERFYRIREEDRVHKEQDHLDSMRCKEQDHLSGMLDSMRRKEQDHLYGRLDSDEYPQS